MRLQSLAPILFSALLASTATAQTLELHFINVGQGDSTLIVCPNGNRILVDAGSTGGADIPAIQTYFNARVGTNTPQLDTLVITHGDADHYNLLDDLLPGVTVGNIYRVGVESDYSTGFWTWLGNFRTNRGTVLASDYFDDQNTPNPNIDCGAANVHVLAASVVSSTSRKNAASIVLLISFNLFDVILTGDATFATENVIIGRYGNWIDVEVLKIGHHGSETTSTSDTWLQHVRPWTAVASAGYHNSHQHARRDVIRRLQPWTISAQPHQIRYGWRTGQVRRLWTQGNYRESIYSTAVNGNVVITSDGTSYTILLDQ